MLLSAYGRSKNKKRYDSLLLTFRWDLLLNNRLYSRRYLLPVQYRALILSVRRLQSRTIFLHLTGCHTAGLPQPPICQSLGEDLCNRRQCSIVDFGHYGCWTHAWWKWLFCNSVNGAESSAIVYFPAGDCKIQLH